jgi:hypothetical protein
VLQVVIIWSVIFNFHIARLAGLNIGIAQAIWSINPFFQALFDKFLYGDKVGVHHFIGMSGLVICAVLVSLSTIIIPEETKGSDPSATIIEHSVPLYVAVLSSFIMPVVCIGINLLLKHVYADLHVRSDDFS